MPCLLAIPYRGNYTDLGTSLSIPIQLDIRAALEKILANPSFRRSPKLSQFLSFVVERKMREAPIEDFKEFIIGTEVLQRAPDFDPRTDNIVRTYANRLRTQLGEYYASAGAHDEIVIEIPRGSYVPVFRTRSVAPAAASIPADALPSPRGEYKKLAWFVAGSAILVGAAVFAAWLFRTPTAATPILEASIVLPPGLSVDPGSVGAFSPDGSAYAFPATDGDGKRQIWLRRLSSSAVRPLPGTDDAMFPFWAPDGKNIAFFANKRLKRIQIPDGPVTVITDAPLGRGGTWNERNIILFTAQTAGPIYRVPADGGTPVPATSLDSKRQETSHRWPHFLPDGNRFLYFSRAISEGSGIWLGTLDRSESRLLFPHLEITSPSFVSRSSKAWVVDTEGGRLVARRVEPRTLVQIGPVQILAGEIPYPPSTGNAYHASRSGDLVFVRGEMVVSQPTIVQRSGKTEAFALEPGDYGGLKLSRDGRRLAYERRDPGLGTTDIWFTELDRRTSIRVSAEPATEGNPTWAPDGREMAFSVQRKSGTELRIARVDGEDYAYDVKGEPRTGGGPDDWSNDGRYLLLTRDDPQTMLNLWVAELTLEPSRHIKNWTLVAGEMGNERQGRFSPDGRMLVYSADSSGRDEVYVKRLGDAKAGQKWQVSTGGGAFPSWNSNGRELFFLEPGGVMMSAAVHPSKATGLLVATPVPLFQSHAIALTPRQYPYAWMPNGKFLVNQRMPRQIQAISLRWNAFSELP